MRGWLAIAGGAAACSGSSFGPESTLASGADAAPISETDPTRDGDTADSGLAVAPVWLDLDGDLVMASGVPDPLASAFRLTGRDPGLVTVCSAVGPPTAFTPVEPAPDGLVAWWDVGMTTEPGCALPAAFRLGIGPYDLLLDPAVAAAGVSGTLYGMYTRAPDDGLWIFGVAGTAENFAGTAAPVTAPPLPDATYRLEGLVLLPVD